MIDVLMSFGQDHILIRVEGTTVTFANTAFGTKMATIDGLKLNQEGVIKEFPDLKDNPQWREIAIARFKNHISTLGSEIERIQYVVADLKKWGYVPRKMYRAGFRPEVVQ